MAGLPKDLHFRRGAPVKRFPPVEMALAVKVHTRIALFLIGLAAADSAAHADWPTFGHDGRRSQVTDEPLEVTKLRPAWRWQSVQPPLPAWGQPAKGDAFSNLRDFPAMRNIDPAFHPIIAGGNLYFASNVDDSVRCLDVQTGEVRWTFTVGGPVRIAPSFAEGHIYFGADDGFAYCISADDGKLIWKFSPSAEQPEMKVLNNGRLISFFPCRTGVLVEGDTAYFGCSMLPWKSSWLCAVDAATGKPEGEGRYVVQLEGMTLEGPLVAGGDLLYAPQGREAPLQFQRDDGKHLGTLKDGFGTFCVLTPDNHLLHGPRKREAASSIRTP